MKKLGVLTFFIIITLVLVSGFSCLASSAPIFPKSGGNLVVAVAIGDTEFNGNDWLEIPDIIEIGAIFTGSSGTTYMLKEYEHEPGEKEYEEKVIGITTVGIWIAVKEG